jgi:hypothetical protein
MLLHGGLSLSLSQPLQCGLPVASWQAGASAGQLRIHQLTARTGIRALRGNQPVV